MAEPKLSPREPDRKNEGLHGILSAYQKAPDAVGPEGFATLMEMMNGGASILSHDGTILFGNSRFLEMLRCSRAEMIGSRFQDFLAEGEGTAFEAFLAKGVPQQAKGEFHLQPREEEPLAVQLSARRSASAHDDVVCVVLETRGERAQAGQAENWTQEQLHALIENSADAIALLDAEGTILYQSPSAGRLLGYSTDEFIGRHALELVHPNDMSRLSEILSSIVSQPGAISTTEFRYLHKDGTWRWIEAVASNALTTPGVGALVVNYRDNTDSRLAQEKLRASETRLRRLIENGSDQIAILTVDGILIYESPSVRPILLYPDGQLLGREIWDLVHADDLPRIKGEFELLIENPDMVIHDQLRLLRSDGTWRWVEGVATNLLGEQSVHGIVLNYHDITGRKQAEEALRESESALRGFLEQSQDAILITDEQGAVIEWNRGAGELTGYSRDQSIGLPLWEIQDRAVIEEHKSLMLRDRMQKLMEEALATGSSSFLNALREARIQRPDGTRRDIQTVAFSIPTNKGYRLGSILRDVTEIKQTENALRLSEERYRHIVETAQEGILAWDEHWRVNFANQRAAEITGYSLEELQGKSTYDFIFEEDRPEHEKIQLQREQGMGGISERPYRRKDGTAVWLRASASPILEQGRFAGSYTLITDITERKQAEMELIQSERDLAEAQRVAHIGNWSMDVQTGAIRWSAELYEIYGIEPGSAESLYEEFTGRIHPGDREQVKRNIEQARATGKPYQHEYRILMSNGETRTVASTGHSDTDASGKVIRVFGTTQDITERKRAEEQLIQSERDLAEAQKVARIGSWSLDLKTGRGRWSNEMYSIFGLDQGASIDSYNAFEKLVYPVDAVSVRTAHEEAIASGQPFRIEHRITLSTGEERTIAEIGRPVLDADGKVTGLFGTAQDITERKRAEAWVRESEARYRALYEDSPVSLWEEDFSQVKVLLDRLRREGVTDYRGYFDEHPEYVRACLEGVRVTNVNRATLELFGADDKSDFLSAVSRFVQDESIRDFVEELVNIAEGKRQFSWEGSNRTLDGKRLDVHMKWSVVPGYEETLSKVLVFIEDVTDRKHAEEQSRQQLKRLLTLREIDSAITSSFDERFTLNLLITRLVSALDVDAADVLLLNRYMNTLTYAVGYGFNGPIGALEASITGNYAGEVIRDRRIISEQDLQNPERPFARQALADREGFKSYYGVPLVAKGEVKGVLEIFHRSRLTPDAEWLDFLETFASQAAIAIDNAQLFEGLQRSNFELGIAYDSTIEGWSRALDLRDKETEGHTQRVTEMAVTLARRFGFNDEEILHVRRGALLHDIGKMGVPDAILLKPGPLTTEEWLIMKKHPAFAYELLSPIRYLKSAAIDIPYCHHERWDGSGYPRGLKSEQIPFAARIFAVVDVWDALISDRPYRPAWSNEKALDYIKSQAGMQFDPQVVESFVQLIGQSG